MGYHVAPGVELEGVEALWRHPLDRHRSTSVFHRVIIFLVNVSSQTEVGNLHDLFFIHPASPLTRYEILQRANCVSQLITLKCALQAVLMGIQKVLYALLCRKRKKIVYIMHNECVEADAAITTCTYVQSCIQVHTCNVQSS